MGIIAAGKLVENEDKEKGIYYDIWKKTRVEVTHDKTGKVIPYLRGQDPEFKTSDAKKADEENDYPAFRHAYHTANDKPRNF